MFTRTHRIGQLLYTEVLESYRDPNTRQPKHRCLARWPASRSFEEELALRESVVACCAPQAEKWRAIADNTEHYRLHRYTEEAENAPPCPPCTYRMRKGSMKSAEFWEQRLARATARLEALRRVDRNELKKAA
jgi:hypothetical protein